MKSVGIVTLTGDTNYGNRLQNFALQEVLFSLGVGQVDSLEGFPTREDKPLKVRRLFSTAYQRRNQHFARVLKRSLPPKDIYSCPPERSKSIREFTSRHIQVAQAGDWSQQGGSRLAGRYDHFVVGSDQVWNPAFTHANAEWFLSFARPEQRVAYAASFGVTEVPRYAAGRYRRGLNGFGAISVREHQAARIVEEFTGRTPPVVLDPTLLLRRERWAAHAQTPEYLADRRYVATFMLASGDGIGATSVNIDAVTQFATRNDLPVIDLHDPVGPDLRGIDPFAFAGAIQGAELVVTDSFHAAVFSTLFHRPFLLVARGSMNSRFETLLRHTGITDRMLVDARDIGAATGVDWAGVDAKLERLRSESLAFLEEALELRA